MLRGFNRHSRASGNPGSAPFSSATSRMPAFAGMTDSLFA
jgi:hypothetical protein